MRPVKSEVGLFSLVFGLLKRGGVPTCRCALSNARQLATSGRVGFGSILSHFDVCCRREGLGSHHSDMLIVRGDSVPSNSVLDCFIGRI